MITFDLRQYDKVPDPENSLSSQCLSQHKTLAEAVTAAAKVQPEPDTVLIITKEHTDEGGIPEVADDYDTTGYCLAADEFYKMVTKTNEEQA